MRINFQAFSSYSGFSGTNFETNRFKGISCVDLSFLFYGEKESPFNGWTGVGETCPTRLKQVKNGLKAKQSADRVMTSII